MNEILVLLPEFILALTIGGLIVGEIAYHGERTRLVSMIALFGLGSAMLQAIMGGTHGASQVFSGALTLDALTKYFRIFFIALALVATWFQSLSAEIRKERITEYYMFLVSFALSACLICSSTNLLVLFLGLQMLGAVGFFLSGYAKRGTISAEAAMKHLLPSAVSVAMFLYFSAILFQHTGTLNMYIAGEALARSPPDSETAALIVFLLFGSLGFYLAAFPMQLWFADSMDGTPSATTLTLGVGQVAVAYGIVLRLFQAIHGMFVEDSVVFDGVRDIIAVSASVTMLVGAGMALFQEKVKRMMVYLMISYSGFLLTGLLDLDQAGAGAILYNLTVGAFSVAGAVCSVGFLVDTQGTDRYVGGEMGAPGTLPERIFLLLFVAALIGTPPFPSFLGKFMLVGMAIREGWYWVGFSTILAGVISLVALCRLSYGLVGGGVSSAPPSSSNRDDLKRRVLLASVLLPVVFLTIYAQAVLNWADRSVRVIFW